MHNKIYKNNREQFAIVNSIKTQRSCRNMSLSTQFNTFSSNLIESPNTKKGKCGVFGISENLSNTLKPGLGLRKFSLGSFTLKFNENLRTSPTVLIHEKVQAIEKLPLTAEKASKVFAKNLSSYETIEIHTFREIFYVGACKKPEINNFDDQSKNLLVFENDHIAYRYQIKRVLGIGSFSQVYEAYDWKKRMNIAIKIIRNKEKYKKQSAKEIGFLKFIKEKSTNLPFAEMLTSFEFRDHICIVFKIIGPPIGNQVCESLEMQKYTIDILVCLQFLHSHKIVHCDLKPSNILLSNKKVAHLIDLGTATHVNEQVYKYVQSRNYRAPEVILRVKYNEKIDMWSLGCLLFEIAKGKLLFEGNNEAELLLQVCRKIGEPPKGWKKTCEKVWNEARPVIGNELVDDLVNLNPTIREVILGCVQWNPKLRISSSEALNLFKKNAW